MYGLVNMTLFLLLTNFLAALIAVQLFRGDIPADAEETMNFSQLFNAFLAMYQVEALFLHPPNDFASLTPTLRFSLQKIGLTSCILLQPMRLATDSHSSPFCLSLAGFSSRIVSASSSLFVADVPHAQGLVILLQMFIAVINEASLVTIKSLLKLSSVS